MRNLASYTFEQNSDPLIHGKALVTRCVELVEQWLARKGDRSPGDSYMRLRDGRIARLNVEKLDSSSGVMHAWELTQPTNGGIEFRTTLQIASRNERTFFYSTLKAGFPESSIQPLERISVSPPKILDSLIVMEGSAWQLGSTPVSRSALRYSGRVGAERLIDLLYDEGRRLPIIVVSEDLGFTIHPEVERDLAGRLIALAVVVSIDGEASWEITRRLGAEWSCYNAGIRIYWPNMRVLRNPFDHWLWTADQLTAGVRGTEEAAGRIVEELYYSLIDISSFNVRCPRVFTELRENAIRERIEVAKRDATSFEDYVKLAELYANDNSRLLKETDDLRDQLDRLKTDLENERLIRESSATTTTNIPRASEAPPVSIAEAVERAKQRFGDTLEFRQDVDRGIADLSREAGPPEKVLRYLEALAEASGILAESGKTQTNPSLGSPWVSWLMVRNVAASGESDMVKNSPKEKRKRTWEWADGGITHFYVYHLKPVESALPDRCVRIYFDRCQKRKKVIIGWVGRHPE